MRNFFNKKMLAGITHYLLLPFLLFSIASCSNLSTSLTTPEYQELHVITSGGFATAYGALLPEFEAKTGIKLVTSYGSSSGGAHDSIPVRLSNGEKFDVIILSKNSLNNLTKLGFVIPDSRVDLVHSMIGMAIKEGAKVPDISTKESFIETLLQAESIGYSASASGRYLSTKLWPDIGLWGQIKDKSKRVLSERVATVVARGEVEIGFQQISEILPIAGAQFVAPIPKDFQKVTTFSTGIIKKSTRIKNAERLVRYLSSIGVAPIIQKQGLAPIVLEKGQ